jgi:general secretion pathway protein B
MSYILDALKKLEHEKTRKNRGTGMTTISGALFEQELHKSSATAGWKIVLAVTAAVVLTFGATWYVLRPATMREMPARRLAVAVPSSAPVSTDVPPAAPAPADPVAAVNPAQPVQPRSAERGSKTAAPDSATTAPEAAAVQATKQIQHVRAKERPAQKLSGDQLTAAPAGITLSGIAWQDERSARRAVVNGFLMQEGGVVSGARITEIYQDRVRFTLSGTYFEIPLTSTGFPAAGK